MLESVGTRLRSIKSTWLAEIKYAGEVRGLVIAIITRSAICPSVLSNSLFASPNKRLNSVDSATRALKHQIIV